MKEVGSVFTFPHNRSTLSPLSPRRNGSSPRGRNHSSIMKSSRIHEVLTESLRVVDQIPHNEGKVINEVEGNCLRSLLSRSKELHQLTGHSVRALGCIVSELSDLVSLSSGSTLYSARHNLDTWRLLGNAASPIFLQRGRQHFQSYFVGLSAEQQFAGKENVFDRLNYCRILITLGGDHLSEASQQLEMLISNWEDHVSPHIGHAQQTQDLLAMVLLFSGVTFTALGDFDRGNTRLAESAQLGPPRGFDKTDLFLLIGRNLELQHEQEQGVASLTGALVAGSAPLSPRSSSHAHQSTNDSAVAYEDSYRDLHRQVLATSAAGSVPTDVEEWLAQRSTWLWLADRLTLQGLYSTAVDLYSQALTRDPHAFKSVSIWMRLAKTCHRCGRLRDALLALQQAIARLPPVVKAANSFSNTTSVQTQTLGPSAQQLHSLQSRWQRQMDKKANNGQSYSPNTSVTSNASSSSKRRQQTQTSSPSSKPKSRQNSDANCMSSDEAKYSEGGTSVSNLSKLTDTIVQTMEKAVTEGYAPVHRVLTLLPLIKQVYSLLQTKYPAPLASAPETAAIKLQAHMRSMLSRHRQRIGSALCRVLTPATLLSLLREQHQQRTNMKLSDHVSATSVSVSLSQPVAVPTTIIAEPYHTATNNVVLQARTWRISGAVTSLSVQVTTKLHPEDRNEQVVQQGRLLLPTSFQPPPINIRTQKRRHFTNRIFLLSLTDLPASTTAEGHDSGSSTAREEEDNNGFDDANYHKKSSTLCRLRLSLKEVFEEDLQQLMQRLSATPDYMQTTEQLEQQLINIHKQKPNCHNRDQNDRHLQRQVCHRDLRLRLLPAIPYSNNNSTSTNSSNKPLLLLEELQMRPVVHSARSNISTHRSPQITHRSPQITHRSPINTHRSPTTNPLDQEVTSNNIDDNVEQRQSYTNEEAQVWTTGNAYYDYYNYYNDPQYYDYYHCNNEGQQKAGDAHTNVNDGYYDYSNYNNNSNGEYNYDGAQVPASGYDQNQEQQQDPQSQQYDESGQISNNYDYYRQDYYNSDYYQTSNTQHYDNNEYYNYDNNYYSNIESSNNYYDFNVTEQGYYYDVDGQYHVLDPFVPPTYVEQSAAEEPAVVESKVDNQFHHSVMAEENKSNDASHTPQLFHVGGSAYNLRNLAIFGLDEDDNNDENNVNTTYTNNTSNTNNSNNNNKSMSKVVEEVVFPGGKLLEEGSLADPEVFADVLDQDSLTQGSLGAWSLHSRPPTATTADTNTNLNDTKSPPDEDVGVQMIQVRDDDGPVIARKEKSTEEDVVDMPATQNWSIAEETVDSNSASLAVSTLPSTALSSERPQVSISVPDTPPVSVGHSITTNSNNYNSYHRPRPLSTSGKPSQRQVIPLPQDAALQVLKPSSEVALVASATDMHTSATEVSNNVHESDMDGSLKLDIQWIEEALPTDAALSSQKMVVMLSSIDSMDQYDHNSFDEVSSPMANNSDTKNTSNRHYVNTTTSNNDNNTNTDSNSSNNMLWSQPATPSQPAAQPLHGAFFPPLNNPIRDNSTNINNKYTKNNSTNNVNVSDITSIQPDSVSRPSADLAHPLDQHHSYDNSHLDDNNDNNDDEENSVNDNIDSNNMNVNINDQQPAERRASVSSATTNNHYGNYPLLWLTCDLLVPSPSSFDDDLMEDDNKNVTMVNLRYSGSLRQIGPLTMLQLQCERLSVIPPANNNSNNTNGTTDDFSWIMRHLELVLPRETFDGGVTDTPPVVAGRLQKLLAALHDSGVLVATHHDTTIHDNDNYDNRVVQQNNTVVSRHFDLWQGCVAGHCYYLIPDPAEHASSHANKTQKRATQSNSSSRRHSYDLSHINNHGINDVNNFPESGSLSESVVWRVELVPLDGQPLLGSALDLLTLQQETLAYEDISLNNHITSTDNLSENQSQELGGVSVTARMMREAAEALLHSDNHHPLRNNTIANTGDNDASSVATRSQAPPLSEQCDDTSSNYYNPNLSHNDSLTLDDDTHHHPVNGSRCNPNLSWQSLEEDDHSQLPLLPTNHPSLIDSEGLAAPYLHWQMGLTADEDCDNESYVTAHRQTVAQSLGIEHLQRQQMAHIATQEMKHFCEGVATQCVRQACDTLRQHLVAHSLADEVVRHKVVTHVVSQRHTIAAVSSGVATQLIGQAQADVSRHRQDVFVETQAQRLLSALLLQQQQQMSRNVSSNNSVNNSIATTAKKKEENTALGEELLSLLHSVAQEELLHLLHPDENNSNDNPHYNRNNNNNSYDDNDSVISAISHNTTASHRSHRHSSTHKNHSHNNHKTPSNFYYHSNNSGLNSEDSSVVLRLADTLLSAELTEANRHTLRHNLLEAEEQEETNRRMQAEKEAAEALQSALRVSVMRRLFAEVCRSVVQAETQRRVAETQRLQEEEEKAARDYLAATEEKRRRIGAYMPCKIRSQINLARSTSASMGNNSSNNRNYDDATDDRSGGGSQIQVRPGSGLDRRDPVALCVSLSLDNLSVGHNHRSRYKHTHSRKLHLENSIDNNNDTSGNANHANAHGGRQSVIQINTLHTQTKNTNKTNVINNDNSNNDNSSSNNHVSSNLHQSHTRMASTVKGPAGHTSFSTSLRHSMAQAETQRHLHLQQKLAHHIPRHTSATHRPLDTQSPSVTQQYYDTSHKNNTTLNTSSFVTNTTSNTTSRRYDHIAPRVHRTSGFSVPPPVSECVSQLMQQSTKNHHTISNSISNKGVAQLPSDPVLLRQLLGHAGVDKVVSEKNDNDSDDNELPAYLFVNNTTTNNTSSNANATVHGNSVEEDWSLPADHPAKHQPGLQSDLWAMAAAARQLDRQMMRRALHSGGRLTNTNTDDDYYEDKEEEEEYQEDNSNNGGFYYDNKNFDKDVANNHGNSILFYNNNHRLTSGDHARRQRPHTASAALPSHNNNNDVNNIDSTTERDKQTHNMHRLTQLPAHQQSKHSSLHVRTSSSAHSKRGGVAVQNATNNHSNSKNIVHHPGDGLYGVDALCAQTLGLARHLGYHSRYYSEHHHKLENSSSTNVTNNTNNESNKKSKSTLLLQAATDTRCEPPRLATPAGQQAAVDHHNHQAATDTRRDIWTHAEKWQRTVLAFLSFHDALNQQLAALTVSAAQLTANHMDELDQNTPNNSELNHVNVNVNTDSNDGNNHSNNTNANTVSSTTDKSIHISIVSREDKEMLVFGSDPSASLTPHNHQHLHHQHVHHSHHNNHNNSVHNIDLINTNISTEDTHNNVHHHHNTINTNNVEIHHNANATTNHNNNNNMGPKRLTVHQMTPMLPSTSTSFYHNNNSTNNNNNSRSASPTMLPMQSSSPIVNNNNTTNINNNNNTNVNTVKDSNNNIESSSTTSNNNSNTNNIHSIEAAPPRSLSQAAAALPPPPPPFLLLKKQLRILRKALHLPFLSKQTPRTHARPRLALYPHSLHDQQQTGHAAAPSSTTENNNNKNNNSGNDNFNSATNNASAVTKNSSKTAKHNHHRNSFSKPSKINTNMNSSSSNADASTNTNTNMKALPLTGGLWSAPGVGHTVLGEMKYLSTEQLICALADCRGSLGEVLGKLRDPRLALRYESDLQLACELVDMRALATEFVGAETLFEPDHVHYQSSVSVGVSVGGTGASQQNNVHDEYGNNSSVGNSTAGHQNYCSVTQITQSPILHYPDLVDAQQIRNAFAQQRHERQRLLRLLRTHAYDYSGGSVHSHNYNPNSRNKEHTARLSTGKKRHTVDNQPSDDRDNNNRIIANIIADIMELEDENEDIEEEEDADADNEDYEDDFFEEDDHHSHSQSHNNNHNNNHVGIHSNDNNVDNNSDNSRSDDHFDHNSHSHSNHHKKSKNNSSTAAAASTAAANDNNNNMMNTTIDGLLLQQQRNTLRSLQQHQQTNDYLRLSLAALKHQYYANPHHHNNNVNNNSSASANTNNEDSVSVISTTSTLLSVLSSAQPKPLPKPLPKTLPTDHTQTTSNSLDGQNSQNNSDVPVINPESGVAIGSSVSRPARHAMLFSQNSFKNAVSNNNNNNSANNLQQLRRSTSLRAGNSRHSFIALTDSPASMLLVRNNSNTTINNSSNTNTNMNNNSSSNNNNNNDSNNNNSANASNRRTFSAPQRRSLFFESYDERDEHTLEDDEDGNDNGNDTNHNSNTRKNSLFFANDDITTNNDIKMDQNTATNTVVSRNNHNNVQSSPNSPSHNNSGSWKRYMSPKEVFLASPPLNTPSFDDNNNNNNNNNSSTNNTNNNNNNGVSSPKRTRQLSVATGLMLLPAILDPRSSGNSYNSNNFQQMSNMVNGNNNNNVNNNNNSMSNNNSNCNSNSANMVGNYRATSLAVLSRATVRPLTAPVRNSNTNNNNNSNSNTTDNNIGIKRNNSIFKNNHTATNSNANLNSDESVNNSSNYYSDSNVNVNTSSSIFSTSSTHNTSNTNSSNNANNASTNNSPALRSALRKSAISINTNTDSTTTNNNNEDFYDRNNIYNAFNTLSNTSNNVTIPTDSHTNVHAATTTNTSTTAGTATGSSHHKRVSLQLEPRHFQKNDHDNNNADDNNNNYTNNNNNNNTNNSNNYSANQQEHSNSSSTPIAVFSPLTTPHSAKHTHNNITNSNNSSNSKRPAKSSFSLPSPHKNSTNINNNNIKTPSSAGAQDKTCTFPAPSNNNTSNNSNNDTNMNASPTHARRMTRKDLDALIHHGSLATPAAVLCRRDALKVAQEEHLLQSEKVHIRQNVENMVLKRFLSKTNLHNQSNSNKSTRNLNTNMDVNSASKTNSVIVATNASNNNSYSNVHNSDDHNMVNSSLFDDSQHSMFSS